MKRCLAALMEQFEFRLNEREVDVWILRISDPERLNAKIQSILSAEENDRAARFRSDHIRTAYSIRRGTLRCLIGRYLGISPADVRLITSPSGKPGLDPESGLEFNVASSEEFALLAFTRGCQLGVDIERIRDFPEIQEIIESHLSAQEAFEIQSLGLAEREEAFFLCWTRKEAYLKAIGEGLLASMKEFQVTVRPGSPPKIVSIAGAAEPADAWTLHDLELMPNYASALAYCDRPRNLVFRTVDLEWLAEAF